MTDKWCDERRRDGKKALWSEENGRGNKIMVVERKLERCKAV